MSADPPPRDVLPEKVVVVPHDPVWSEVAADEAAIVRGALGSMAIRIDHVGSTAVTSLPAKPVIDLQISVRDRSTMDACRATLEDLGYVHVPIAGFEDYPFYGRQSPLGRRVHIHLCVAGSHNERRHLAVRDHLRSSAEARIAYGQLKLDLMESTGGDRDAYIDGKDAFLRALEREALAQPDLSSLRDID